MTEHPDTILYLLFESIRGDWLEGIDERGKAIIDILSHTTFKRKDEMAFIMENMILWWNYEKESFDGRHWARDGKFCYYKLFKEFETTDNLSSTLLRWGESTDGTKRLEHNWKLFGCCHEDVMELYEEWKNDERNIFYQ